MVGIQRSLDSWLKTRATHLVVLGAVAEDEPHVGHKLLRRLVVLRALHLQLPLHLLQVHGLLDDLVVVGYLGEGGKEVETRCVWFFVAASLAEVIVGGWGRQITDFVALICDVTKGSET